MTCNPSWRGIKNELLPCEHTQNQSDMVAHMFHTKLEQLNIELFNEQIFGSIACFVYINEFQKRSLPHAQFLIIMKQSAKLHTPDLYVSTQLPDEFLMSSWTHTSIEKCGSIWCTAHSANLIQLMCAWEKMELVKIVVLKNVL